MPDDPRKGPVKARMRHALARDPVIGDTVAVGTDQSRRAHDLANIFLGDRGDQHPGRTLVLDQIVADDVDRVLPAPCGEPRWFPPRVAADGARSRSARSPRTGCGPSC